MKKFFNICNRAAKLTYILGAALLYVAINPKEWNSNEN
jgi:hypothetical protein